MKNKFTHTIFFSVLAIAISGCANSDSNSEKISNSNYISDSLANNNPTQPSTPVQQSNVKNDNPIQSTNTPKNTTSTIPTKTKLEEIHLSDGFVPVYLDQYLNISQTQVTFSKNFTPTISFVAKNTSNVDIDVFCLSFNFSKNPNIRQSNECFTEKTFNKSIKSGSEINVKVSLQDIGSDCGTSPLIIVTKIHYVDGTAFKKL